MQEKNLTKQELLDKSKELADKHSELKTIVTSMLDEMDKLEVEFLKIMEKLKKA